MDCSLWNSSLRRFLNPYVTFSSILVPRLFPVRIKKSNTVLCLIWGHFTLRLLCFIRPRKYGNTVGAGSLSPCLYEWEAFTELRIPPYITLSHNEHNNCTPFIRLLVEGCENSPPPYINFPHYMTLILKPRCWCQLSLFR